MRQAGRGAGAGDGTGCVATGCSSVVAGTGRVLLAAVGRRSCLTRQQPHLCRFPSAAGRRVAARGTGKFPATEASADRHCEGEMVANVRDVPGRRLAGTAIKFKNAINAWDRLRINRRLIAD